MIGFDEIQATLVIVPSIGSIVLVLYITRQRLKEGLRVFDLPLDRKFQIGFFYTGALLTIYLSMLYFFSLTLQR